jgi:hypothetical protein
MSIKLRFVRGLDFSSRVIAWFSAGHLSHVDAVMPDGSLLGARSDVIKGIPTGVQIRQYEGILPNHLSLAVSKITPVALAETISAVGAQIVTA